MALTRIKTDQITNGAITGDDVNATFDLSNVNLGNLTSTGIDDNSTAITITIDGSDNVGIGAPTPTEKLDVDGNVKANTFVGNADTASAWFVARDITLGGDLSGSVSIDGSQNVTLTATVADDSHNHVISNVDGLQDALDLKAPLNNPALTGVPTAPTAANSTNTTQIATTAFVQSAVSGLVDSAPTTLNTLNELAAALGDDPNFATTVSNQIGTKLDGSASITLSGDVSGTGSFSSNAVNISVTVVDDSHNHVISNVDGLQTALDAKLASSSYTASDVLSKLLTVDGSGSGLDADLLDGNQASAFHSNGYPIFSSDAVNKSSIVTRTESGFYEHNTSTTADGWPVNTNNWQHLIACTHTNDSNYYSMQIAGPFFDQNFYGRKTGNNGNQAWVKFWTSGDSTITAVDFNATSDIKFKTDINTIESAVNKVNNLRGVNFKWIESDKPAMGVIAQEVENIIPEVVSTDDKGDKSVNYSAMVGLLIEAIKSQQEEIDQLKKIVFGDNK